jgi:3-oxoacyl-[acyl-carrier protein] reductase
MSEFSGKIALVTGGSSGIGATTAKALAARGAIVAVVASSNVDKAARIVDEIRDLGGEAYAYAVDVRDGTAVKSLLNEVVAKLGGLDILVNAAGVFLPSPTGETPPDVTDRMIDINVKGTWNCIQAAVEPLKKQGGGKILNFASVAGLSAIKGFAIYCASKAAIVMMTRAASAELAPFNINVNALAPGNTETPMNEGIRNDPAMRELLEGMKKMTPSGVTFSKPEEIAEAALYLLSRAARPVHGTTLLIDEGFSAALG